MERETVIQRLKEVQAEIGELKTIGPRARDSSRFQIMREKALKWLEFGGRDTRRQYESFENLSFGDPAMRGPQYYADPTLVKEYEVACDVAHGFLESAIENVTLFERTDRGDIEGVLDVNESEKSSSENCVFIGHGHSGVWKDLRDLIKDRLGLEYEEFNRESAAGISNIDRLKTMLQRATFAFLIMTGEDKDVTGQPHARENVIHEAGLFQGKLGFARAILLLEEECAQFSNIEGLGQIRFPKGNITAKSEEIRRVLEREGILSQPK